MANQAGSRSRLKGGLLFLSTLPVLALLSCGGPSQPSLSEISASRPGTPDSSDVPEANLSDFEAGEIIGKFRNTYYFLALESDFTGQPANSALLDIHGNLLARVTAAYKKSIAMEGSGKLKDGRVLNFAAYINNETRYRVTHHAYGDGVGTCALEPFHTIAVDPRTIPLGTWVKIDETEGMRLPDGTLHNGIWRAEDRGAWINNDRIDLFVGAGERNGRVLEAHGIKNLQALTVRLAAPPAPDTCAHREPPQTQTP